MPNYRIDALPAAEKETALAVWEASVRATHDFVQPEHIEVYRRELETADFAQWTMFCARDAAGHMVAMAAVKKGNLDMLFVHPDHLGAGVGGMLLRHAMDQLGVQTLQVNVQNEAAVGFYRHFGFQAVGRSEVDGSGKPYPIMMMALPQHA